MFSSIKFILLFLAAFAFASILLGFIKGAIQQRKKNKELLAEVNAKEAKQNAAAQVKAEAHAATDAQAKAGNHAKAGVDAKEQESAKKKSQGKKGKDSKQPEKKLPGAKRLDKKPTDDTEAD